MPARVREGGENIVLEEDSVAPWIGITRGARSFGDSAALDMLTSARGAERGTAPEASSADRWRRASTGELIERSWRAGRPGIVAIWVVSLGWWQERTAL